MRLFVGVEINAQVVDRIAECLDELRRRVARRARRARISWVPPDRLHVTVRFIGEASDSQAREIATSLSPMLPLDPFEAIFTGLGAFPPHGPPRVLWAGIGAGVEPFVALEREVTARLDACGIPSEERPYRPHVTIARVREPAGLRTRPLLDEFHDRAFGASSVETVTLFQSRLSPKGSVYVPLQSTHLRRASSHERMN
jgi:RNA 2',3'-cyclic 3'-phosphodiesterase